MLQVNVMVPVSSFLYNLFINAFHAGHPPNYLISWNGNYVTDRRLEDTADYRLEQNHRCGLISPLSAR